MMRSPVLTCWSGFRAFHSSKRPSGLTDFTVKTFLSARTMRPRGASDEGQSSTSKVLAASLLIVWTVARRLMSSSALLSLGRSRRVPMLPTLPTLPRRPKLVAPLLGPRLQRGVLSPWLVGLPPHGKRNLGLLQPVEHLLSLPITLCSSSSLRLERPLSLRMSLKAWRKSMRTAPTTPSRPKPSTINKMVMRLFLLPTSIRSSKLLKSPSNIWAMRQHCKPNSKLLL
mmetsp:Transcript_114446/g.244115  ORF Transcript_114446/g.244115 Transcript_114446/m.244115 type:complete len:227 (+) Transcript_114446:1354-2034(+)